MEQVQVWFDVYKVEEGTREEDGRIVHFSIYTPAEKIFLGECEATPKAVAELAGVHEFYAAEVLNGMGYGLGVFKKPCEEGGHRLFYLIVFPAGKQRPPYSLHFRLL